MDRKAGGSVGCAAHRASSVADGIANVGGGGGAQGNVSWVNDFSNGGGCGGLIVSRHLGYTLQACAISWGGTDGHV